MNWLSIFPIGGFGSKCVVIKIVLLKLGIFDNDAIYFLAVLMKREAKLHQNFMF